MAWLSMADNLAIFIKITNAYSILPSCLILVLCPIEILALLWNDKHERHCTIMWNSTRLDTTQMSNNRELVKWNILHPFNRILCSWNEWGQSLYRYDQLSEIYFKVEKSNKETIIYSLLSLGYRTDIYTHVCLYMHKEISKHTQGDDPLSMILRYTFFSHVDICETGTYLPLYGILEL